MAVEAIYVLTTSVRLLQFQDNQIQFRIAASFIQPFVFSLSLSFVHSQALALAANSSSAKTLRFLRPLSTTPPTLSLSLNVHFISRFPPSPSLSLSSEHP